MFLQKSYEIMTEQISINPLFIGIFVHFEIYRIGREKIFVYNEDKNKAMLATFLIVFYSSFKKSPFVLRSFIRTITGGVFIFIT